MGLSFFVGEVQKQAKGANQIASEAIQAVDYLQRSIAHFLEAPLSGKTYDSAKRYFSIAYTPLRQSVILTSEALTQAHQKFLTEYESQVGGGDSEEDEIRQRMAQGEQVKGLIQELINQETSFNPRLEQRFENIMKANQKLEERLEKLYAFNATSTTIFTEYETCLAELRLGIQTIANNRAWDAGSGTFDITKLNMTWAKPIQARWKEREKQQKLGPDMKGMVQKEILFNGGSIKLWVKDGKLTVDKADIEKNIAYNKWLAESIDVNGLEQLLSEHPEGFTEFYIKQNLQLLKELSTGRDALTGEKLSNAELLGKGALLTNTLITLGVSARTVQKAGKQGSQAKKSSGAEPVKQPNDFVTETFLPEEYYKNNYSSMDGAPNSRMEFYRMGSSGNVEKSVIIYNNQGKQSMRIDYSNHGNSLHHTNPHIHEYEWKNGYKNPSSHKKYFLDKKGVLRPGRIDQGTNRITFDFDK